MATSGRAGYVPLPVEVESSDGEQSELRGGLRGGNQDYGGAYRSPGAIGLNIFEQGQGGFDSDWSVDGGEGDSLLLAGGQGRGVGQTDDDPFCIKGGSSRWHNVPNFDLFLTDIYIYFQEKGFRCSILSRVLNLITIGFVAFFTVFIFGCINYSVLWKTEQLSKAVDFSLLFSLHPLVVLYIIVFLVIWIWQFVSFVKAIPGLYNLKMFFREELKIKERDIQTIRWREVTERIVQVQARTQLCLSKRDLTGFDIANRIMRKDNYFIALFNRGILDLSVKIPGLGKYEFLTRSLEWNLRRCIIDYAFPERSHKIRSRILNKNMAGEIAERLSVRFRTFAVINIVLSPFIAIFLVMFFFFKYAEEIRSKASSAGMRQWANLAKWKFREFNELPHIFQKRMGLSHPHADTYINNFCAESVTIIARFVVFISGSIVSCLVILSLYDDDALTNVHVTSQHTVIWFITVFGVVIALGRGLIPDENLIFEPERLMQEIVKYTHYYPQKWLNKAHTFDVRDEMAALFELKLVSALIDILSVFITPYILYFKCPAASKGIVEFFRDFTVWHDGLGHVCSFATFDFKRHGNPKYAVPKGISCGTEYNLTSLGKMEKSFVNFKNHNPDWAPEFGGREYLDSLYNLASSLNPAGTIITHDDGTESFAKDTQQQRMPAIGTSISSLKGSIHKEKMPMRESQYSTDDNYNALGLSTLLLDKFYAFNGFNNS
eukprot:Nk52_evm21s2209 gene=Nk52_evmTU21s2209